MSNYDSVMLARRLVYERVREWAGAKRSIGALADKSGVSRSTVARLIYGETQQPRATTVAGVLEALGIQTVYQDRETGRQLGTPATAAPIVRPPKRVRKQQPRYTQRKKGRRATHSEGLH